MILAAVSSYAWSSQPNAVKALLTRLVRTNQSSTVVLDRATVRRETELSDGAPIDWDAYELPFSSWLKEGLVEDGVIDIHLIRKSASQLSPEKMIVVDASGHRDELITAALAQARYAWFPLDQWHPAFILICDDIYLLGLADELAHTFYCQPEILTDREAKRIARTIRRRAFTYRWMGPGAGKFEARVFRTLSAIVKWWDNYADRVEKRKL